MNNERIQMKVKLFESTFFTLLSLAALIVCPTSGCSGNAGADKERTEVVTARAWLSLIDQGDYLESWKESAPFFQGAITETNWETSMATFRRPLGNVLSRELKSARLQMQMPGAPDGQYVVMRFETSFANKKSAVETVTVGPKQGDQWKVSGYYIK